MEAVLHMCINMCTEGHVLVKNPQTLTLLSLIDIVVILLRLTLDTCESKCYFISQKQTGSEAPIRVKLQYNDPCSCSPKFFNVYKKEQV